MYWSHIIWNTFNCAWISLAFLLAKTCIWLDTCFLVLVLPVLNFIYLAINSFLPVIWEQSNFSNQRNIFNLRTITLSESILAKSCKKREKKAVSKQRNSLILRTITLSNWNKSIKLLHLKCLYSRNIFFHYRHGLSVCYHYKTYSRSMYVKHLMTWSINIHNMMKIYMVYHKAKKRKQSVVDSYLYNNEITSTNDQVRY